jgi:hypothetical protein
MYMNISVYIFLKLEGGPDKGHWLTSVVMIVAPNASGICPTLPLFAFSVVLLLFSQATMKMDTTKHQIEQWSIDCIIHVLYTLAKQSNFANKEEFTILCRRLMPRCPIKCTAYVGACEKLPMIPFCSQCWCAEWLAGAQLSQCSCPSPGCPDLLVEQSTHLTYNPRRVNARV